MSDATLTDVLDAVQTQLNTNITSLKVHRHLPDSVSEFPIGMIYSRAGRMDSVRPLQARNFFTIAIDIYTDRQDLSGAMLELEPYPDLIQQAIFKDISLGGVIDHAGIGEDEPTMTYELGSFKYGGTDVLGYRFEINVKAHRNITA